MANLGFTASGYVIATVLFFLLLNTREDLGTIQEQCNTDKLAAVAEAERITRETTQFAYERRLAQLEALAKDEREASALANMAREDALREAETAQETIRRLMREASNNETATLSQVCLNTGIDPALLDGLR